MTFNHLNKYIEEITELNRAIIRKDKQSIKEESADVFFMTMQILKIIEDLMKEFDFSKEEINNIIRYKAERLEKLINGEKTINK